MSTLIVELPDTPEIREGDEVTIRARMKGHRLVADNVRRGYAPQIQETEEQAAVRAAALDELWRLCDQKPPVTWTDEEMDRMRYEHIEKKHLK